MIAAGVDPLVLWTAGLLALLFGLLLARGVRSWWTRPVVAALRDVADQVGGLREDLERERERNRR